VAAGIDKFYLGEFADALEHLRRALATYDRQHAPAQIARYGQDMGIAAEGFLGWALAVVGDLDEATARADHVVKLAREIGHPFSLALALFLACEVHQERHDPAAVAPLAEELLALGRDHSYTFFTAFGLMQSGWARVADGDVAPGLTMMREGAELFRSIGQRVGLAHRARLAEGLLAAGELEAALGVVADALEQRRQTEEGAFAALLLCVRGEALARDGDPAGARLAFRESIETARGQGAWLFALRAACRLARLEPGSLEVLGTIARHFPDAADTPDLSEARALLGKPA
jgi:tetratricopeptide (TPR) repeat protein